MTPDEFRESVLPAIEKAWQDQCLCDSPVFRKLVSFNFDDYGVGPTGLADAEILIDEIIRKKFEKTGDVTEEISSISQRFRCPRCGSACTEFWREFNINMSFSHVLFDKQPKRSDDAYYLVGFFGFARHDFANVSDFHRSPSTDDFLQRLITANRS